MLSAAVVIAALRVNKNDRNKLSVFGGHVAWASDVGLRGPGLKSCWRHNLAS